MNNSGQLKILAIIPSGFCFGLQHITVDLFSKFPTNIHSHFMITHWTNGEMETLLKKNNFAYSFSWFGMFSRKMDWLNIKMSLHALIKLPLLYADFKRTVKRFSPDIVYFANHHELILLSPVLNKKKYKVVCHMHDPSPAIPFQKKNFSFYSKKVDRFIAISESVKERTIALGCDPSKIKTIHNGIAIPQYQRAERKNIFINDANWNADVIIIGITGQMTATKGLMDLLEAFYIVQKENKNVRLVIGGKKSEPLFGELQKKINDYAIAEKVWFSGWMNDVSDFFKNIDVFVLASRHDEGYGLVVAEAMVHELPVVITKSGGAVELVQDGKNGFIVEKNNPVQMSEKILYLTADMQLRKTFGQNGRKRITEKFDLEKQAALMAEFLQELKYN